MDWMEFILFNAFGVLIFVFWQILSEWWEKRGGGAALPRYYMVVIGAMCIGLINTIFFLIGSSVMEFFDLALNISSIVFVIGPLLFLLLSGSFQFTSYLHKLHKKTWLTIPAFLMTVIGGAWVMANMLRRFVVVFGGTQ